MGHPASIQLDIRRSLGYIFLNNFTETSCLDHAINFFNKQLHLKLIKQQFQNELYKNVFFNPSCFKIVKKKPYQGSYTKGLWSFLDL